ncbi:uncharacterized protein C22orf42-like [Trachypithecus francoisi]|uniref:uncharacterized protein C22orf42-like n=1 Tax=Trachypithecus francoisi TaxID=54180 RepID=UPI00141BDACE|nr:uncharacterized protein C22orf42-like [Trachypithecus francoisi]
MNKLRCPMGPCSGLICDCCRLNVGPCEESETPEAVAAAAPASTAAEPARFDLGATEVLPVHYHSNAKISKDSDEDLQASAHGGVEENMGSELVRRISFSGRETFFVFFWGF